MEFEITTLETVKRIYKVEADSELEAMASDKWKVENEKGLGEEINHILPL